MAAGSYGAVCASPSRYSDCVAAQRVACRAAAASAAGGAAAAGATALRPSAQAGAPARRSSSSAGAGLGRRRGRRSPGWPHSGARQAQAVCGKAAPPVWAAARGRGVVSRASLRRRLRSAGQRARPAGARAVVAAPLRAAVGRAARRACLKARPTECVSRYSRRSAPGPPSALPAHRPGVKSASWRRYLPRPARAGARLVAGGRAGHSAQLLTRLPPSPPPRAPSTPGTLAASTLRATFFEI